MKKGVFLESWKYWWKKKSLQKENDQRDLWYGGGRFSEIILALISSIMEGGKNPVYQVIGCPIATKSKTFQDWLKKFRIRLQKSQKVNFFPLELIVSDSYEGVLLNLWLIAPAGTDEKAVLPVDNGGMSCWC